MKQTDQDRYFGVSPRVARWHISSPVEHWLGRKADTCELFKRLYLAYYRLHAPAYHRRGQEMAAAVVQQRGAAPAGSAEERRLVRDMVYSLHRFGVLYTDYWIYDFADKTASARAAYVADKLMYHYDDLLNGTAVRRLMTDKWACYQAYRPFFRREMRCCRREADRAAFLDFATRHDSFIVKPIGGDCGRDTEIVRTAGLDTGAWFGRHVAAGFVAEPLIAQGAEMAALHPQSVNTLRVMTFVVGGEAHILGVALRMGTGAACVDNAGAGGLYANVDFQHGIADTPARDYAGHWHNFHPDTGVQIVGFRLPRFDEAMRLAKTLATHRPDTTLIAWDLAFGRDGWLMVEGNTFPAWTLVQVRQGLKARLYALMDRYFEEKGQQHGS